MDGPSSAAPGWSEPEVGAVDAVSEYEYLRRNAPSGDGGQPVFPVDTHERLPEWLNNG